MPARNRQCDGQGANHRRLPGGRNAAPEIEGTPKALPRRRRGLLLSKRGFDERPKRRTFLIITQLVGRGAQLLPGSQFFGTSGAGGGLLFKRGPFFGEPS